jgi:hypothetical protein
MLTIGCLSEDFSSDLQDIESLDLFSIHASLQLSCNFKSLFKKSFLDEVFGQSKAKPTYNLIRCFNVVVAVAVGFGFFQSISIGSPQRSPFH